MYRSQALSCSNRKWFKVEWHATCFL